MAYRRRSGWKDVLLLLITALSLAAIQIFVIWAAFNFLGRAFSWPKIDFWQAGALYILARALVTQPSTKEDK